ncbi:MAG: HEAT repeat domain-containing protein [Planctomycetia bacterium]|nr:HEAT repeat domain-containing protein [Planctomycetia bacterium]
MNPVAEDLAAITLALRRPDTVLAAVAALHGRTEIAAVEGLVELLHQPPTARAGVSAVAALEGCESPIVVEALHHALHSPHASLRLAVVEALHRRGVAGPEVRHVLQVDDSWPVRRAALRALADGPERWAILAAADDPHWRVRHALIEVLLRWGELGEAKRIEIDARLTGDHPRIVGLRRYLAFRWHGAAPAAFPETAAQPITQQPFWDWDAFVLFRNLERLADAERRQALDWMPELLIHADERIVNLALETLWRWGEARHFAAAVALRAEPRTGSTSVIAKLLERLDDDQRDDTAQLLGKPLAVAGPLPRELSEEHPYRRAATLTPERAAALVQHPRQETSWQVLAQAARLMKTPLWKLEPAERWQPAPPVAATVAPLRVQRPAPPRPRLLGPSRLAVAPLGVSGHYGLPVAGFVRALEAGVNLLFWEPNYATLTEFSGRLAPAERGALHFIAGTFEADGQRVERDAERALRLLRLERLPLFLLFWVQNWNRITPDVRAALDRLKAQGKIGDYGLSTHSRPLAIEAMQAGWNPVMVRHSLAHRGAESRIFPKAVGTSIITFNNTCYGRLLKAAVAPAAADCYRYALGQPGVTACLSAPATLEQLEENLQALRDPELRAERIENLRRAGDAVYREDTVFRRLVRER